MATAKKATKKTTHPTPKPHKTPRQAAPSKAAAKTAKKPAAKITTCTLSFPFAISPKELNGFRGAIIQAVAQLKPVFDKARIATDLFHNHDEEANGRQLLRHPAIVYQSVKDNGAHFPHLFGVGAGVAALQLLAQHLPAKLTIYRRQVATHGFELQQARYPAAPQKKYTEYALYKWLALNPDNYTRYKNELRFTQRVEMLNEILKKNILGWYAAAGCPLSIDELQVFITEITAIVHDGAEHNGRRMFVFDCTFAANIALPVQMALGNGTARGYGKVRPLTSSAAHAAVLQQAATAL